MYGFRHTKTGLDLVTFWDGTAIPDNKSKTSSVKTVIKSGHFKEPVWVDLPTGNLYAIPAEIFTMRGEDCGFHCIPVSDSSALITDKRLLSFVPARQKKK